MFKINEYTISNGRMKLTVLNIGAIIKEFSIDGFNTVLSFADNEDYRQADGNLGGIIGRSAGRVANAEIEGWKLPVNLNDKHNLHGNMLNLREYQVEVNGNTITLTLDDPEGEFPGNANIKIEYTLLEDRLSQTFTATSDKPTLFNMTNHSYFKLDDADTILDHKLQIECDKVGVLNEDLLTVDLADIKGTVWDFNELKTVRTAMVDNQQFEYSKFIDHPFHLTGDIALESEKLRLKVKTDQDYVVVYAGNFIGEFESELNNCKAVDYAAICLETQAIPGKTELTTEYQSNTEYILEVK